MAIVSLLRPSTTMQGVVEGGTVNWRGLLAALFVDAENISGALKLYEDMGFRTVKRHTTYRKPLD